MYLALNLLAFFLSYYKRYLNFFIELRFLILTMILFILFLISIILNPGFIFLLYFEFISIILLIIAIHPHFLSQKFILYAFIILFSSLHKRCTSIHEISEAIQITSPFILFYPLTFLFYFFLPKDLASTKQFQTSHIFFLNSSTLLNCQKYLLSFFLFKQIKGSFPD